MGMGALILKGLFAKAASPLNVTVTGEVVGTLPQVQHLLTESNKAGKGGFVQYPALMDRSQRDLTLTGSWSVPQVSKSCWTSVTWRCSELTADKET